MISKRIVKDTAVGAAIADHIGNDRIIKHAVYETGRLRDVHNSHRLILSQFLASPSSYGVFRCPVDLKADVSR